MADVGELHEAITDAYLKVRPYVRTGRAAFRHRKGTPFPSEFPEGIDVLMIVADTSGEMIYIVEGEGLPLTGHGMMLRTYPNYTVMLEALFG